MKKRVFISIICTLFWCQFIYCQTVIKSVYPGHLQELIEELKADTCSYLVIKGKLNSADLQVLRRMAGCPFSS